MTWTIRWITKPPRSFGETADGYACEGLMPDGTKFVANIRTVDSLTSIDFSSTGSTSMDVEPVRDIDYPTAEDLRKDMVARVKVAYIDAGGRIPEKVPARPKRRSFRSADDRCALQEEDRACSGSNRVCIRCKAVVCAGHSRDLISGSVCADCIGQPAPKPLCPPGLDYPPTTAHRDMEYDYVVEYKPVGQPPRITSMGSRKLFFEELRLNMASKLEWYRCYLRIRCDVLFPVHPHPSLPNRHLPQLYRRLEQGDVDAVTRIAYEEMDSESS